MHVIDYEYGSFSYRGFDIGNHFNEFAGFECDYSKYPDKDYQYWWLTEYLTPPSGDSPSPATLDALYSEINRFSLASHLFWGLWGLVQAKVSSIGMCQFAARFLFFCHIC